MDLLGAYGSSSDEEEEQQQQPVAALTQRAAPSTGLPAGFFQPAPAGEASEDEEQGGHHEERQLPPKLPPAGASSLFASMPPPRSTAPQARREEAEAPVVGPSRPAAGPSEEHDDIPAPSGAFKLPAPKSGGASKRVVEYRLPLNKALLESALERDEDAEDLRPAKKAKPSGGQNRLLDFLPKPRHDMAAANGSLGGGSRLATRVEGSATRAAPAEAAAAAAAQQQAAAVYGTNEMYAVADDAQHAAYYQYDPSMDASTAAAASYHSNEAYSVAAEQWGGEAGPGSGRQAEPGSILDPAEALLQEALGAEQARAARRAGGGAASSGAAGAPAGIQFKEINQSQLTFMDPAAKAEADSVRQALGSEYAAKLKAQATAFGSDKLGRRKGQIGTLFANAKMQELEMLEQRSRGMKNKSATQAKYGW